MAFTMRAVKVPPNSVNLEEARTRTFQFFKAACRSIPTVMDIYNLHDVATVSQLRSTIASEIRKNAHINNPKACIYPSLFPSFASWVFDFLGRLVDFGDGFVLLLDNLDSVVVKSPLLVILLGGSLIFLVI
ncbi:NADH dehydrogenase ubiquinone 1 alpha subcomplex subunit 6 [Cinnamomum micranthum f. kanehirae]|uniref:NADH dehydrogenase ubiquinone 1 alpha subcomplex subunit 6 n=1 Tax=Cinnamomum micranthum f. kanehirae TaxID=337451 RepID=A0A443NBQ8_9MAGN|nr:NADH dehydrogenase ubiquinone 1 alpha subcomplex subunit 6 [Cinnamomum micranthum f. kanehirae]